MEYIPFFLFGWMVVSLPAIIVTAVTNSRRRSETADLNEKIITLTRQIEALDQRSHSQAAQIAQMAASPIAGVPAVKGPVPETRPAPPIVPVREPVVTEKPAPPISAPTPPPATITPPIAAQAPPSAQPKPVDVGRIPLTPVQRPPAESPSSVAPPLPAKPPITQTPAKIAAPPPPATVPEHVSPVAASSTVSPLTSVFGVNASAEVRASGGSSGFSSPSNAYDIVSPKKRGMSLEEMVGTNLGPKIGIAIVVIGVGFLVAAKWGDFSPWLRVLLLYAGALAALVGGIFTEKKERYQTLGRALIGGGWAVTVLVTYGLKHAPFMAILSSNAVDLLLLMAVIGVMVWHTLKYNSQLVTGAGFLLGFAAITLMPPIFGLVVDSSNYQAAWTLLVAILVLGAVQLRGSAIRAAG